jgi:hypothetical protein
MNDTEFVSLVRSMRRAQDQYTQTRKTTALIVARDWEKRVDSAIAKHSQQDQPGLFEGPPEPPHEA